MSIPEVPSLEKLLSFKLSELKKALKAKSLSTTGSKAELAERLHVFHVTAAEEARLLAGNEPNEAELLGEIEDVPDPTPAVENDVKVAAAAESAGKSPTRASKAPKPAKTTGKRKAAAAKPAVPVTTTTSETKEETPEKVPEAVSDTNGSIEKPTPVEEQPAPSKEPVEPPAVPKKPVTSLSDEERKRLRGERFSTHLTSTDEDMEARKRARAERFGLTYIPPKTATSRGASDVSGASLAAGDVSLMQKRAARFGEIVAPSLRVAREEETRMKRLERFGGNSASATKSSGNSPSDEEKRKRRLERFGATEGGKGKPVSNSEDEERKKRRLERFGGTTEKSPAAQPETLQKRAKRFGLVEDDEKKAARALRFGVSS